jgi:hypothetical protein
MVAPVSPLHLAYDELDTPMHQRADCAVVGRNLRLEGASRAAVAGRPSIECAHYPREVTTRPLEVSAAAARLANALHLHLD